MLQWKTDPPADPEPSGIARASEPSLSHLIIGKNLLRQQGLAPALQQAYLQGKYGTRHSGDP